MGYEHEAPAHEFQWESYIHSLALWAGMRLPSVRQPKIILRRKCIDIRSAAINNERTLPAREGPATLG